MNDYLLIIIGSILVVIGALASFIEKSYENKISKKKNIYNVFAFGAIFFGIVIAFYSGFNSINDKKESDNRAKKSQTDLIEKSDLIISIQEENKKETKYLNDSLSLAKSKIINLQKEINNNVIGSLNPCFLVFQTSSDRKGFTVLVNEGKLPIIGLMIYITDFNKMMKCKQSLREDLLIIDKPCYDNCTKSFRVDNAISGNSDLMNYSLPDIGDSLLFEIRFKFDRNIEYMEQLICRRSDNIINCLGRLFVSKNNTYEFIKIINPQKLNWEINFDKVFNISKKQQAFMPITWR